MALTGTPVSVIASDVAADAGVGAFGYFEFALVGIPLLPRDDAIVVFFGERLLPDRSGRAMPADLSKHARTLVEQYRLDDGLFQLRVRPGSPYVGAMPGGFDLRDYAGLSLVSIQAGDRIGTTRRSPIMEGDLVVVRGPAEAAAALAGDKGLAFRSDDGGATSAMPSSTAPTAWRRS